MRILIAEDDPASRLLLQKLLEPYGDTEIAANGREAVEAFGAVLAAGDRYALICLDIMMPEMDGQQALKEIREIEAKNDIPGSDASRIVMTTALSEEENVMKAFRKQCDGYLTKPVVKEKLVDLLRVFGLIEGEGGESPA